MPLRRCINFSSGGGETMSKVERACVRQRRSKLERPWDRGLFGVCMRG